MKCGFDIASIRDWIFRVSELVTHHKLAQFDYVTTEPRYFRISTHPEFTEVLWGDDPEGVGKWVGNAFSNLDKVSPTVPACILIDCKDLASRTPTALDPSFEAYLKVLRSMESEGGKDA